MSTTPEVTPGATNNPTTARRTIEYAVIGYGASAGQFVADLALQRSIVNSNPPTEYNLKVTVYSSQGEKHDGAGDAWGPEQDGCINSDIPAQWVPDSRQAPNAGDTGLRPFVEHATQLKAKVEAAALERFDGLRDKLREVNQPGAALLLARRQGSIFVTDLPCVPRSFLGQVRKESLKQIVKDTKNMIDGLEIIVKHRKLATVDNINDPLRPQVLVYDIETKSYEKPVSFDKVISFSGARRQARLPPDWSPDQIDAVYTGLPNAASVAVYLQQRNVSSERNTIGFAGAQLSFIDLITLVATKLGAFDFTPHEGHGRARCTAKLARDTPYRFIVFSREETGSVKPRLSFGMDWPGTPEGFVDPVSYLGTEHLLALRTQRGYQWLEVIETIWKSMIAYRMNIHPSEYPRPADMIDEWVEYYEECERFRRGEPTYCGLERTLINAAAHGFGAESSVLQADERMKNAYSAIFVSGERMIANLFAHVCIVDRLETDGPNEEAIKILERWYRTYSSSPINICQPVFQLAVNGVLKHRVGDARQTVYPTQNNPGEDKIQVGGSLYKVDAFFPPTPFSTGIDNVISKILPTQLPANTGLLNTRALGVPVWHVNGQLEDTEGQLVNVWDCGNNRGSNLDYEHINGGKSIIKPRLAVHLLSSSHEFAPPLAACMLAHDAYMIRGNANPSRTLNDAILGARPCPGDFDTQMNELEDHYKEIMERYEYLKAIQKASTRDKWRNYFKKGLTSVGREEVMVKLTNSNEADTEIADAYRDAISHEQLPGRNPFSYNEWHNAFTDQEITTAWTILKQANAQE